MTMQAVNETGGEANVERRHAMAIGAAIHGEIIAKHARQMAALRKWDAGGRKGLLAPELKAKWLDLVLEHDGVEVAALEMDRLATNDMPRKMQ